MAANQQAHTKKDYLKVFGLLFVITLIEFGIVYVEALRPVVLPILFILSAVKFWYVVSIFMHLKFEHKYLSWMFASGMILAIIFVGAMWFLRVA